jgi:5-methylcytosine-specific restriction endonuclease McrA
MPQRGPQDAARVGEIFELRAKGASYSQIAAVFRVTKQRVHQIITGYEAPQRRGTKWWKTRPPKPPAVRIHASAVKLRFQILERDGFTCRYCGRKPPEVVLQIDHVVPVSKGGFATTDNLVTACRECNNGKRDVLLAQPIPEVS